MGEWAREWFVDNKLSIRFGEVKTKCIFFSRRNNLLELNMTYYNNRIKQFYIVEPLHKKSLSLSLSFP